MPGDPDKSGGVPEAYFLLRNERGIALILVLVLLLLLSILGMTVLTSTIADLQMSASYKNEGDAFYAADAAMEFAQVDALIYSSLPATAEVWPAPGSGVVLQDDGTPSTVPNTAYPDYNQIVIYKDPVTKKQPQGTANMKVDFVGTGAVPPCQGTEVDAGLGGGSGFRANYYVISVIADGPNDSHTELESQIARVVPR